MMCENSERPDDGTPCGEEAEWIVHVGTRETDRQLSCSYCLGVTCQAMHGAEGRVQVDLRVAKMIP